MSEATEFSIPLSYLGDEGAGLRLANLKGQVQRQHVIQRDDGHLAVHADLPYVLHGTLTPGGKAATLLILDFRFGGSRSEGRRFREATIDVGFACENRKIGEDEETDPIVCQMAPYGTLRLDPATVDYEQSISLSANAGAGVGLAVLGVGAGFERKTTVEKTKHTILYGSLRISGRNCGPQNAVRWSIVENATEKGGIPGHLRTAILITPRTEGKFKVVVTINAKVDIFASLKRVFGGAVVDPVYFGALGDRKDAKPESGQSFDIASMIDTTDMMACKLGAIGALQVSHDSLPTFFVSDETTDLDVE